MNLELRTASDIAPVTTDDSLVPATDDGGVPATPTTEHAEATPATLKYVEETRTGRILHRLGSNSKVTAILAGLLVISLGVTVDARLDARMERESSVARIAEAEAQKSLAEARTAEVEARIAEVTARQAEAEAKVKEAEAKAAEAAARAKEADVKNCTVNFGFVKLGC